MIPWWWLIPAFLAGVVVAVLVVVAMVGRIG